MEEVVKTVVRIGLATRCCNGPGSGSGSGWLRLGWSWVMLQGVGVLKQMTNLSLFYKGNELEMTPFSIIKPCTHL